MTTTRPTDVGSLEGAEVPIEERGMGWVGFAGVMIGLIGVLNVIYGIAAISDSKVYVRDAQFVFGQLNTWGWILLIVGVVQLFAAFAIFARTAFGRWIGILTAGANMIVQLLLLPAFPLLSLAIFAIDVLVIYGLVAYAHRARV
ncbi:MAG: hypothetical protein ACJ76G_02720 [Solirubrobacterales bacterium]|jgi:hypothetical protein